VAGAGVWTPLDPLGEALQLFRMSGAFYARSELTAPWALSVPPMKGFLMLHVVRSGSCFLEGHGAGRRLLRPSDLTLVPHGEGHRLSSAPGVRAVKLFDAPREETGDRYELLRFGGGGAPTSLVCAAVRFDHPAAHRLVALLPRLICIDAERAPHPAWIESTLRVMADEARDVRGGGEAVLARLADVLVLQSIRWWLEKAGAARAGWLSALQDRQIGRALVEIHRDPARAWSVASLASEAALSRSAFSARFTELVGEPALRYVARVRMQVARTALEEGGTGVGELAGRLGYRSEAAFCRAFKRLNGVPPGAVRRRASGGSSPRGRGTGEAARDQVVRG